MTPITEACLWGGLAAGASCVIWGVARMLKPVGKVMSELDEELSKPEWPAKQHITPVDYVMTSCKVCRHSIASAAYPMLTCTLTHDLVYPAQTCARGEK